LNQKSRKMSIRCLAH